MGRGRAKKEKKVNIPLKWHKGFILKREEV